MDPLTRAAQRFVSELRAFWEPAAGTPGADQNALRLTAEPEERVRLLKSLRLAEWQPDSHHPLVTVESACESEPQYIAAVFTELCQGMEQLGKGLSDDGVQLGPLEAKAPRSIGELGQLLRTAGGQVASARHPVTGAPLLDGLALALLPERVLDPQLYTRLVTEFCYASDKVLMRLAVLDVLGSGLERMLPVALGLKVSRKELLSYLSEIGPKASSGPAPADQPKTSLAEQLSAEAKLGRKLPSDDTVRLLRRLLLQAAEHLNGGRTKAAIKKYRAARTLCRASGLMAEEAMLCLGLGSAEAAASKPDVALAIYRDAERLAKMAGHQVLVAQALLGQGGANVMAKRYATARVSYGAVIEQSTALPALRLEAERMIGECFLAEGNPRQAVESLYGALAWAESAGLSKAEATGVEALGGVLQRILSDHRREREAAEVRSRIAAIIAGGPNKERIETIQISAAATESRA